jgi:hypothetical protein
MGTGYIIVKRRADLCDAGVFTGEIMLASSESYGGDGAMVLAEGRVSSSIEHAFVFDRAVDAFRWCERLLPDPAFTRNVAFMTWVVRDFPQFEAGMCFLDRTPRENTSMRMDVVAADAFRRGITEGYRRAYEER